MFKTSNSNCIVKSALTIALLVAFNLSSKARVVLPALFSDHMVFQQKTNAAVWGKAKPGIKVTVTTSWNAKKYSVSADANGDWKVKVLTPSYGGPYKVQISDGELTELKDVLIGDVWVCSGQSNMEMPLAGWGKIKDYEQEIAQANYPQIRLLQVDHVTANQSKEDAAVAHGGWMECNPANIAEFSAVAYFFAREVTKKTKIPIGLLHTSWGGTVAEAWMSGAALKKLPDFEAAVTAVENTPEGEKNKPNRPGVLYNAMIHPFINFAIKGVIWYQGESNAERAAQYRTLFPALITDWREKWNIGNFPFYFVQLANFMKREAQPAASAWAELRDAQLQTLSLPNTGMAVIIDIGEGEDIHPKNKQEVGRRLALVALAKTYHQDIPYSGPVLQAQKVAGNKISLTFKEAAGLKAGDAQPLKGFAIAGADQKFYWADAVISGNEVVLSAADVKAPVAVRYDWGNNPDGNLYNGAGLPASPFRTDNWKDVTVGVK